MQDLSDLSDEGFVQDYVLGRKQRLFIYCRLCRRTFPVEFVPPNNRVKLRCVCGHEGPLSELDIFRSQEKAEEHATFYEKVYRAARSALEDAGLPIPPSARFQRLEDLGEGPVSHSYNELEDKSDILSSYQEPDESEERGNESIENRLADFDRRLRQVRADLVATHELLDELIEFAYCRRHLHPDALRAFLQACRADMAIAKDLVREVKRRRKEGEQVKVSFSSFKHLMIHLDEDGELDEAIRVAEQAAALGLKGYAEKAQDLRSRSRRR